MIKVVLIGFISLIGFQANAQSQQPIRIYKVDSYGNTQYHKESYKVEDKKVYKVDSYGNTQYHKPHLKVVK